MNITAKVNSATIPSRAWFGDEDIELVFPTGWNVTTLWPNDAPKLESSGIEDAFRNPIGTKTIAELAAGKASAAIIVDDLSRPTPVAELIPYVLRELEAAGLSKQSIQFVVGGGSHRPLTQEEVEKKVGADVAKEYTVISHDCYAGDLRGIGKLPDGTPLYFNRVVADAEFKMTIGGIYPHGAVGFGGGAKLILPGVSGFATMFHFHSFYASRGHGVIESTGGAPDHRHACEAAAKALGLDMIVNTVINSHREIAGVFVGDFIEAHRAGARFALKTYGTVMPADVREKADIAVINAYPLDSDAIQTRKTMWPVRHFDGVYGVSVNPACDGTCYHGLFDQIDWQRYSEKVRARKPMKDPTPQITGHEQTIIWSENFPIHDLASRFDNAALFREWSSLIDQLAEKVPADAHVVVFPCAGIQVLVD